MAKKLVVEQFLDGMWVRLIKLDTEGEPTQEEIDEGIAEMSKGFYDAEKAFLTTENYGVCFWPKDGPLRVKTIEVIEEI